MTKKDKVFELRNKWHDHNAPINILFTGLIDAIIDALPDEAPDNQYAAARLTARDMETRRVFEEDARKLRIMKAMEDMAKADPMRVFKLERDTWVHVSPIGTQKINDMYSLEKPKQEFHWRGPGGTRGYPNPESGAIPENAVLIAGPIPAAAPLWEGEISVFGDSATSAKPDYPEGKWRRIKVREVRP